MAALLAAAIALPAAAQESTDRNKALEEFSKEAEEAFRNLLESLKPGLEELLGRIDELTYYEAPEILPNGDIIIRRKKDAPPLSSDQSIDL